MLERGNCNAVPYRDRTDVREDPHMGLAILCNSLGIQSLVQDSLIYNHLRDTRSIRKRYNPTFLYLYKQTEPFDISVKLRLSF